MNPDEYRKKIEEDILNLMEKKLLARQMDAARAKELARYVLDTLKPNMTMDEIHEACKNFEKNFSELVPIALEVQRDYDNKIKEKVSSHVSNLLKQGNLDEAHALVKKTLGGGVKLGETL